MKKYERLAKELREVADDPDHHPMLRALFRDAADLLEEQANDLEAHHRHGSDHQ